MVAAKRKPPARAAKKDPWTDEEHLFSAKSKLTQVDLHKYFLNPEAWNILSEAEKAQIRSLLPPHIVPDDDGSLPQEFLKYDMDWRNALRLFQSELEAGHYEAEWLEQAAQAMEERAAGKFDKWKEEHFEEFWGQKQKLAPNVVAGNMANLKLDVLIKAGVFEVGDIWRLSRSFGRDKSRILIEKDATIIHVESGCLTFAIPPGQYKYLSSIGIQDVSQLQKLLDDAISTEAKHEAKPSATATEEIIMDIQGGAGAATEPRSSTTTSNTRNTPDRSSIAEDNKEDEFPLSSPRRSSRRAAKRRKLTNGAAVHPQGKEDVLPTTPPASQSKDPIIIRIEAPGRLENKMIETDGRIKLIPKGNAWKSIRVRRDEQDLGSLWEIREEFWVRESMS